MSGTGQHDNRHLGSGLPLHGHEAEGVRNAFQGPPLSAPSGSSSSATSTGPPHESSALARGVNDDGRRDSRRPVAVEAFGKGIGGEGKNVVLCLWKTRDDEEEQEEGKLLGTE